MIIKLQTTMAEQESDIIKLSDELYVQQKEIIELKKQYAELASMVKSLSVDGGGAQDASAEPPPPHY